LLGNERSRFATCAACWRLTRKFTRMSYPPNLSEKAGTPWVTKKETRSKAEARGSTLAVRNTAWKATSIFLGT
jgi:hypothetical protein